MNSSRDSLFRKKNRKKKTLERIIHLLCVCLLFWFNCDFVLGIAKSTAVSVNMVSLSNSTLHKTKKECGRNGLKT